MVKRLIVEPLLFGLIGAAVNFHVISASVIPKAIAIIIIGVCVRVPVAFLSVFGSTLNLKERAFVGLAWIGKATVQAALASEPYNLAQMQFMGDEARTEDSLAILTVAVFSILITAPVGMFFIQHFGTRWLEKTTDTEGSVSGHPAEDEFMAHRDSIRESIDVVSGKIATFVTEGSRISRDPSSQAFPRDSFGFSPREPEVQSGTSTSPDTHC